MRDARSVRRRAKAVCGALLIATVSSGAQGGGADVSRHDVLRIDGVPVTFEHRELAGRAAELRDALATNWRAEFPDDPVVRSRSGEWHIVGQRRGREFRTAQFRDADGRAFAAFSSRDIDAVARDPHLPFRLPRGTRIVRTIETMQESPAVLQVIADAAVRPEELRRQIDRSASREGWRTDMPAAQTSAASGSGVQAWARESEQMLVVIGTAAGRSTLLLHVVRSTPREGGAR